MKLLKRTWADISMDNLSHNYHLLRDAIPADCRFLGVVKADAYGHGAVPVSRQLVDLGADYLAVSNMEEAVQLRRSYIRLPILILGYTPAFYAEDMVDMGIRQEVHSLEYARQLDQALAGSGKRLKVHIKLDTGMSRLGFFANDERSLEEIRQLCAMEGLLPEGIFTHFSVADSLAPADQAFTAQQFEAFTAMVEALAAAGIQFKLRHCCNSAATLLHPEYALDMVRPGIATYGISPSEELAGRFDLRPLMSLRTTVSQIRPFQAEVGVSYGRSYTTPSARTIAVLSIGYADGLPRSLSNRSSFLLHGKRVPVVGRICMDMCMVDVTEVPEAKVGDVVTVFGTDGDAAIPVDDLARLTGTIPYETLCSINKRTPRFYLDGEQRTEVLQYIV
ncbi:MAG: alanine racemase [Oscillospiraceae bacterium]|nr:alanine racemase [Oscillospiraceae bacterium]